MNRLTSRNKTTRGRQAERRTLRNISIPPVFDSLAPGRHPFGCWGTDAGARHYCAAIDLGRSGPDCKWHEPRNQNQQT